MTPEKSSSDCSWRKKKGRLTRTVIGTSRRNRLRNMKNLGCSWERKDPEKLRSGGK